MGFSKISVCAFYRLLGQKDLTPWLTEKAKFHLDSVTVVNYVCDFILHVEITDVLLYL